MTLALCKPTPAWYFGKLCRRCMHRGPQPGFHHLMANDSCLLENEFSGMKDSEIWDAAHVIPRGKMLILVRVDLQDNCLSSHLLGRASHLWSGGAAWSTPIGPEVDENRNPRTLNDLIKKDSVDRQGLVQRRQRTLAGTTTSSVGQVLSGESVFLITALAGSDCRHRASPCRLDFAPRFWLHAQFRRAGGNG